jgi:hypothetical protein
VLINGAKIMAIRFSGANIGKEENGHEKMKKKLNEENNKILRRNWSSNCLDYIITLYINFKLIFFTNQKMEEK